MGGHTVLTFYLQGQGTDTSGPSKYHFFLFFCCIKRSKRIVPKFKFRQVPGNDTPTTVLNLVEVLPGTGTSKYFFLLNRDFNF